MTRQSLQALRQTITVTWPKATEQAAKELLIRTAKEGTAKIVSDQTARAGVRPGVTTYANQEGNTDLESVKLPGPIVSNFHYVAEIVQVALKALAEASPRDSGLYAASHTVFVNGEPLAEAAVFAPAGAFDGLGPADEIFIANRVPYARKIEVGKTESGRAFVIQVEPHIYERVMAQIRARYRTVAKIAFNYVSLPNGYHGKKGPMRYPAITIGPLA